MNRDKMDISRLWKEQKVEPPSIEELYFKMERLKRSNRKAMLFLNLIVFSTTIVILFIWYFYQPRFLSTKLGVCLTIGAMAIYVIAAHRSRLLFRRINRSDGDAHSNLNLFLAIKKKQRVMQTIVLNLYFIFFSIGLLLYMYEYVALMTFWKALVAYLSIIVWIIVNWFYFRPKQIRKQQQKLNEIIDRLQHICDQMNRS